MSDATRELADRVHFLRLEQRVPGLFESEVRLPAFGDVASDLGEADELADVVIDRVDDHIGPETLAALADAPAFLLETPLPGRDFERCLRFAVLPVFLGVEQRKILADDFVGHKALDALRAGIPRGHPPVRLEQKN